MSTYIKKIFSNIKLQNGLSFTHLKQTLIKHKLHNVKETPETPMRYARENGSILTNSWL